MTEKEISREIHGRNISFAATTLCPSSGLMRCQVECVSFKTSYWLNDPALDGEKGRFTNPYCSNLANNPGEFLQTLISIENIMQHQRM